VASLDSSQFHKRRRGNNAAQDYRKVSNYEKLQGPDSPTADGLVDFQDDEILHKKTDLNRSKVSTPSGLR